MPPNTEQLKVLIPLFDGCNTLDVNGPLDVICNYALRGKGPGPFHITTTAKTEIIVAYEGIKMVADMLFAKAKEEIQNGAFDIMLIPGSGPGYVDDLAANKDEILDVISLFLGSKARTDGKKWLVSICTGGVLAGAAGAFEGLLATTHKGLIATGGFKKICKDAGYPLKNDPANDKPHRWVDGGPATKHPQTRILSSGGISCGLDASLYLVHQILDQPGKVKIAFDVASMMDYNWNIEPKAPSGLNITVAQKL